MEHQKSRIIYLPQGHFEKRLAGSPSGGAHFADEGGGNVGIHHPQKGIKKIDLFGGIGSRRDSGRNRPQPLLQGRKAQVGRQPAAEVEEIRISDKKI